MIPRVDDTLRRLFAKHVALLAAGGPVTDDQIGFAPPDADWRGHVLDLGTDRALNVYLVELRDNRRLRSNERTPRARRTATSSRRGAPRGWTATT